MQFFFIRFMIFASLISLMFVWARGLDGVKTNTGGFSFGVLWLSTFAVIAYFLVLFLVSFIASAVTSKNKFPLNFHTVLLADTVFSYALILITSRLFLTESGASSVSSGGNQGALVVKGLRTVLGWRQASDIAKNVIWFSIVLHFLFFIHNYIATRNQSGAEQ